MVMLTAKMGFTYQHLQKQWLTKGGVVSGEKNAASFSGIARQQGASVLALSTNHNKTCLIRPAQAPATCQYTTAYTVRAEQNHHVGVTGLTSPATVKAKGNSDMATTTQR